MFLRALALTALIVTGAQPERPTFEVASVKQNVSGESLVTFNYLRAGGRFTARNVTLRILVRSAYQVQDSQLIGGPAWANSDHFDIVAKADLDPAAGPMVQQPDGPTPIQLMLRALLEERFKLVVHRESRPVSVFELVVAR